MSLPTRVLCSLTVALALTACPSAGTASDSTDEKDSKAKSADNEKLDARPDAKTPDAEPDTPKPEAVPPAVAPEVEQAVATSINAFAVDLHRELGKKPGNSFVSPASIAIAFAMVHAGAKGPTADELAKTLHVEDTAKLHPGLAGTLARWDAARGGLELDVANRLFGEKTLKFEPTYLELMKATFAAPLEPLDFKGASGEARTHINDWVAQQTKDKIKDLLPSSGVTAGTRLVLVNAIYFKARWTEPFQVSATEDALFTGAESKATVKMMHRSGQFKLGVAKAAKLRTIELPYDGSEYSMVIVLPDDPKGLPAVEKALTAEALASWIDGATQQYVALGLPRFEIEPGEGLALRAPLEKLGIVTAWDANEADFTGIAPASDELVLSEAYHEAFIAVDEEGTEAAAATALSMVGTGRAIDEPIPFVADHPFLFLVRDRKTGAILFMGRLVDPAVSAGG
jgi:serpin B